MSYYRRPPQLLETHGPANDADVHYSPQSIIRPFLSFDEFRALPDHQKHIDRPMRDDEILSRVSRLMYAARDSGKLSYKHVNEIIGRLAIVSGDFTNI